MPFHVVNSNSRYVQRLCNSSTGRGADQQRANQSGAGGIGHTIDLCAGAAGLIKAFIEQRNQFPDVVPGCDFGNHSAVFGMNMGL